MADPSTNSQSLTQQILQSAGFYPPTIYDLLTRYGSLQTQYDSQSTEFLPLTDVLPPASSQTLPFVIGFIPPPAPTGATLSREASVAQNSNNSPPLTLNASQNVGTPTGSGGGNGTANSLSANGANFIQNHEGTVLHTYNDSLGLPTIGIGHLIRPGEDFSGGITNEQAQQLFLNDSGGMAKYIQNNVHVPLTQNQFDALMSFTYGAGHIAPSILTPLNMGDYAGAAAAWQTTYLQGKNADGTFAPIPGMDIIRANEVNLFNTPDGQSYAYNPKVLQQGGVSGDVQQPNGWNNMNGGGNAQSAAIVSDSVANTSLNTTALGQQFQQAQAGQVQILQQLVNQMATTPPLRMLVNPRSFKNSLEKITADGNWGRNGPIIEHWGEQLDKIEGSGKIAAFYSLDNNPPQLDDTGDSSSAGPGLSRMTRNYSASYQNFLSLYLIYRSNAGIWTPDFNNTNPNALGSQAGPLNLATVGSVYIFYDNILYVGCFDNFNITESDEVPFALEYTFTFTVRAWFLLDQQQDPLLAWQQPVNGSPQTGMGVPQNGWGQTIPSQGDTSSFGPSGGQPTDAQQNSSNLAATALQEQINSDHETQLFGQH